jgi:hypothetical protein
MQLIDLIVDFLNRLWPFINIGWGGLAPVRVEAYTNSMLKYNS